MLDSYLLDCVTFEGDQGVNRIEILFFSGMSQVLHLEVPLFLFLPKGTWYSDSSPYPHSQHQSRASIICRFSMIFHLLWLTEKVYLFLAI